MVFDIFWRPFDLYWQFLNNFHLHVLLHIDMDQDELFQEALRISECFFFCISSCLTLVSSLHAWADGDLPLLVTLGLQTSDIDVITLHFWHHRTYLKYLRLLFAHSSKVCCWDLRRCTTLCFVPTPADFCKTHRNRLLNNYFIIFWSHL